MPGAHFKSAFRDASVSRHHDVDPPSSVQSDPHPIPLYLGYDWVGWRNDSLGWAGKPVEMVFEFDTVRNFSAMVLHTNNMYSKDVQVFLQAKVYFSIGGQHFSSEPVQFSYMPDAIMESARDVTIKLHHRIGRYIQVHLYFAMRWIMLSEISFIWGVAERA
ncbi:hypothetical protein RP20_CCG026715 [Aedes albopictus]|nr:hypothetical protein RP20_CCG026715 [Aedes albopictus]